MNSVNTLRRARDLISDPKKWTKGAMGRKRNGDAVVADDVKSIDVVKWCMSGALRKAANKDDNIYANVYWYCVDSIPTQENESLHRFNDHPSTTHQDVMSVFDRAISKADRETITEITKPLWYKVLIIGTWSVLCLFSLFWGVGTWHHLVSLF